MVSNVRIGLVGTGYWGKNLARNLNDSGNLSAICDFQPDVLQACHILYPNVLCFSSMDKMLESADIDAVVIATPAGSHRDLALRALQEEKHVFVEKPLCLNVEDSAEIVNEAKRRNLCLMVGHLLLYHPAFVTLSAKVSEGVIGKLRYIYSNRLSLGKIRRDENALWSFAPHDISMILQLTGRMPREVFANGGSYIGTSVADTTISHLKFDDELQAHIFVSWLHPYKDHRLVVVGSKGMIEFNDVLTNENKLTLYPHLTEVIDDVPLVTKAEAVPISYSPNEPLAEECRHFISAITEAKVPRSDGAEATRVLRVLDACQRSLDAGTSIALSTGERHP